MTQETNGFTPVLIKGEGLSDAVLTSTFLDDPKLISLRDDYICAVREFAKKTDREHLDLATEQIGIHNGQKTPSVVKQMMDALQKSTLDRFTRNSSYLDARLQDATFAGLDIQDVEEFFKGFEEALVRFYSYSQLASSVERNVPSAASASNTKVGKFEDLATCVRNDIGNELLTQGLLVLSRMQDLGHIGNIEYDAADTPVLFFSRESLEQLFDILDAIDQGEISLSPDFPSVEELMERILEDPEVAPNEIMRIVRNGVVGDQDHSHHPSVGNSPAPRRMASPKNGGQSLITSRDIPGRHLHIVR